MHSITNSDVKMAAQITFSSILSEIQHSNLNFKIELSPFSASITLKKTAITDSNGFSAIPTHPSSFLLHQAHLEITKLSQEINRMKDEANGFGFRLVNPCTSRLFQSMFRN